MTLWGRVVSRVGGARVVSGLGGLYVALAAGRAVSVVTASGSVRNAGIDFALVGGPGLALLYAGYRLPRTDVRRETYPRIVAWCLGVSAMLLVVVGLLVLDSDITISQPSWSTTLAAAIGSLGGLAIGTNEARAITRAHEAEEQERELERQNERLESFASMLAHELRNPLTIAQIYLPEAAAGDDEAAEEVETALGRIEEMIEILLVTARSESAAVSREDVSLPAVAEDAWADLAVERASLVVETDRVVRADPVHVRHLLENLFRNAVEHGSTSPRSGAREDAHQTASDAARQNPEDSEDAVEHSSTSNRPEADDPVEHAGSDVAVTVGNLPDGFYVADDGPGIAEADRSAVFEAGYTTEADGIGLGLTFVAQLAETYGWDCRLVESKDGGARFEFTNVELVEPEERPPR